MILEFYDSVLLALIPALALLVDFIYGDPRSQYHPVVMIGNVISYFEKKLYPSSVQNSILFMRGCMTVFLVLLTVGAVTGFLIHLGHKGGILLYTALSVLVLYFCMTPKSLTRDGMEIYHLLKANDIKAARQRLSWIVGRDTENLNESDIVRGTVETIAENTTDGVISPLFYYLLLGPVGAALYRAGNTMDSMLGYKNDRYLFFGRCAARLDDVLNYIPARITFVLFLLSSMILHLDWKNARKIGLRDAPKHPSPNGGYAEAPMAGALHVRLGGYNYYEGKPEFREYMGNPDTELRADHIKSAIYVMYVSTVLFILAESVIIFAVW